MEENKLKQAVNNFDEEHTVSEVILLGEDGAIRRVIFEDGN